MPLGGSVDMATSFHRNARCPHIGLKEGGEDLMLTGGLLPFPRTGCVLYAKAILSYGFEIRQIRPLGRKRLCSNRRNRSGFQLLPAG